MTIDIFIKSYPKDFNWLVHCLRSIQKYAQGYRDIVLVVPPKHGLPLTREKVIEVADRGNDGYMFQQVCKLNADIYSDADMIFYMDSDMILTRPYPVDEMLEDGKPLWRMTPWDKCEADVVRAWKAVMEKCMGHETEYEFMGQSNYLIPRWALAEFRQFMFKVHGMEMEQYVMSQPYHAFTEFNCIGAFLYENHRDKFRWMDRSKEPETEKPFCRQFWSWGGLTPECQSEIDEVLS